eukprot:CAMPEP_0170170268 /NCGR_PEP_ID=MMETSP0040_2-20121228/3234_1 /TAXON_ID=641309 /ORGANISM="Lotharella oceanica, Strain CCMP622" /LENGTH=65 /DNA_ID=CAMNT_0010409545 /DNA_START=93 /DNA_END=290 /DNA_ORIENTATION=-
MPGGKRTASPKKGSSKARQSKRNRKPSAKIQEQMFQRDSAARSGSIERLEDPSPQLHVKDIAGEA